MPYAPGVQSRVGDYFASVGPQFNQNLQLYLQNKRDREQTLATAETLGRFLDPEGVNVFGPDLGKLPDMSLGKAKGVLGGLSMYLHNQWKTAQGEAQRKLDMARVQQLEQQNQQEKTDREALANLNTDLVAGGGEITADRLATAAANRKLIGNKAVDTLLSQLQQHEPALARNQREAQERDALKRLNVSLAATGGPVTSEQLSQAALRDGLIGNPYVNNLLVQLQRNERVAAKDKVDKKPTEFTTDDGTRVLYSPWTGAFQSVPVFDPKGSETLVELKTPTGEVKGWGVRSPKTGGITPIPTRGDTAAALRQSDKIRANKELAAVNEKLTSELRKNTNLTDGTSEKQLSNRAIKNLRATAEYYKKILAAPAGSQAPGGKTPAGVMPFGGPAPTAADDEAEADAADEEGTSTGEPEATGMPGEPSADATETETGAGYEEPDDSEAAAAAGAPAPATTTTNAAPSGPVTGTAATPEVTAQGLKMGQDGRWRIAVIAPDGRAGFVPLDNIQTRLSQGFRLMYPAR